MALQLGHQAVLDVQDATADLADRVLVVLAGDLVVDRAVAQADRPERARRRERLQRTVDRAAGKARLGALELRRDLVRGAVAAQPLHRLPDLLPLTRLPHPRPERRRERLRLAVAVCHREKPTPGRGESARAAESAGDSEAPIRA